MMRRLVDVLLKFALLCGGKTHFLRRGMGSVLYRARDKPSARSGRLAGARVMATALEFFSE